jgi:hypothetical protein
LDGRNQDAGRPDENRRFEPERAVITDWKSEYHMRMEA